MQTLAEVERLLWFLSVGAIGVLLVKMWKERLIAHYRYFTIYLVSALISASVLAQMPPHTSAYAITYFCFAGLRWVLYVLITLELFSVVLVKLPGLATVGKRLVKAALALSLTVALLSLAVKARASGKFPKLEAFYLTERVIVVSVLFFLAAMVVFLLWFPVPLSRNATVYALGYTIYFASKVLGLFAINLRGTEVVQYISPVHIGVSILCCGYWIARLNSAGEDITGSLGGRSDPAEEARLLRQLQSLNSSLNRSRYKRQAA